MRWLWLPLLWLAGLTPVLAAGARASDWAEFREVRVRLLLIEPAPGDRVIRGGIGFRLAPDFKTYWRSPGDSGVPPSVELVEASGLAGFQLAFPFPTRFDDGAGGHSWGYKQDVILPFTAKREENDPIRLKIQLDFAVCGTMCIPLSARLKLDPGQPVSAEIAVALERAHALLPRRLDPEALRAIVQARRIAGSERPRFDLEIRHDGAGEEFALFAEGNGYFHIADPVPKAPGVYRVTLVGRPAPGTGGRFGPVRLTFGSKKQGFEGEIDLDGLPSPP